MKGVSREAESEFESNRFRGWNLSRSRALESNRFGNGVGAWSRSRIGSKVEVVVETQGKNRLENWICSPE